MLELLTCTLVENPPISYSAIPLLSYRKAFTCCLFFFFSLVLQTLLTSKTTSPYLYFSSLFHFWITWMIVYQFYWSVQGASLGESLIFFFPTVFHVIGFALIFISFVLFALGLNYSFISSFVGELLSLYYSIWIFICLIYAFSCINFL